MSDDTNLPLRDVAPEDYYLAIKSLDSGVIALAPSRDARFPRVIAVGSGQGQLLRTSLELVDACIPTQSSNLGLYYFFIFSKGWFFQEKWTGQKLDKYFTVPNCHVVWSKRYRVENSKK